MPISTSTSTHMPLPTSTSTHTLTIQNQCSNFANIVHCVQDQQCYDNTQCQGLVTLSQWFKGENDRNSLHSISKHTCILHTLHTYAWHIHIKHQTHCIHTYNSIHIRLGFHPGIKHHTHVSHSKRTILPSIQSSKGPLTK